MPLAPRTRLGTYEILGPLGAGGMGEVYRATDLRLRREVAIKVLPADVASSPERLARFEREARTVAGLNHPNIVTLHSVEDEDGVRFLTMELVDGQTLSALVSPGGLPLARLLELTIPLADALVAAHEKGVIHRDLKPGNVMVTREGRVKVLDFGLAKVAPLHEATTLTARSQMSFEGQVLGTVPYMSPEQVRGEVVDARSDLFSLGIIVYELATGRRPFMGNSNAEVTSSILRDTPEPVSRVRADLPRELQRIIEGCLDKDPGERTQTALDVGNALRRLRRAVERGDPIQPDSENVPSIAVLPFSNRSPDEDDEYFSDGLADELLSILGKVKGLRVSARVSSFHFKGKDVSLSEIGSALNVAAVLDGSVRKAGNRVRISVQLVKIPDGYHLWSETYDRILDDIFAVQDDIARSVVTELRTALLGGQAGSTSGDTARSEVTTAAKGRCNHPEAYRLYLLARHLLGRWTHEDTLNAIRYLKEALTLDPQFASAWTELSRAYSSEASRGWVPMIEGYARARWAAERALSSSPDLAEGHVRLGWIRMSYDLDWRGAEASMNRALELAPGNAVVLGGAGVLAYSLGRPDRAARLCSRALEQDPLNSAIHSNLGMALHAEGCFVEAERAYGRALELAPKRTRTRSLLSVTFLAQERGDDALAESAREPEEVFRLWAQSILYNTLGRTQEADIAFGQMKEKCSSDSSYQIAEVHAVRREFDAAFEWLERAYVQRDGGLAEMKSSPSLRSLHGDPRWSSFLKKMGFE